ncbi:MAG: ATP-dependent DNA helicase [Candidatus Thermoplasmatota archaeon]|nr:ATP-dependent DNA helicase [Candidatus Thermoplasmatota archaeon]MBS3790247.1 ATP-dependent DNA helicase [Candidatus Thermoplasmatota archaeon]
MEKFCDECGSLLRRTDGKSFCPRCKRAGKDLKVPTTGDGQFTIEDQLFPFRNIRKGQKKFMEDVEETFKKEETLIAHAPTGIGKTAAVLPPVIREKNDDQKIFFLTSKQSQHNIAIETIKNMPESVQAIDVISKKNMCLREASKLPYPVFEEFCSGEGQERCNLFTKKMSDVVNKLSGNTKHVSELVRICESFDVCPHKSALLAGKKSDIIVCDYNYIFSDIRERIFDLLEIELENALLIVDEAHNLPDRIRGNLEERLDIDVLQEASSLLQGYSSAISSFMSRLARELTSIDSEKKRIQKEFLDGKMKNALKGGLSQFESMDDLLADLKIVARDIVEEDPSATAPMRVYSFLDKWEEEGEEIFRSIERSPLRINVKLMDPSRFSGDVFKKVAGAVLMSGTLHPGEMYADILGIKGAKIEKYSSPFPNENRKIVSVDNLTTAYKERGLNMYQAYANSIADVANNTPGNVAVFFPSYDLMNRIYDRLNMVHLKKGIIIEEREHSKKEKKELVDGLKKSDDNILLAVQGGSLSEGVDYRDNILSSVMIVGIPFPPPSLEVEALEEYYTAKFDKEKGYKYSRIYPAMNRVLQAAGRPIRSKTDRALIILADKRFNYERYKKNLPKDFDYTVTKDVVKTCKSFFKK